MSIIISWQTSMDPDALGGRRGFCNDIVFPVLSRAVGGLSPTDEEDDIYT